MNGRRESFSSSTYQFPMALVNKGTGVVLLAALILLSAAASMYSMNPPRPGQPPTRYRTFRVILSKPPNAAAMDEAAHRRWHQSFLPSTRTDSGLPRLRNSYYNYTRWYGIYAFSARLTDAELEVVAKKPGFELARPWRPKRINLCRVPARQHGWKDRIARILQRFLNF